MPGYAALKSQGNGTYRVKATQSQATAHVADLVRRTFNDPSIVAKNARRRADAHGRFGIQQHLSEPPKPAPSRISDISAVPEEQFYNADGSPNFDWCFAKRKPEPPQNPVLSSYKKNLCPTSAPPNVSAEEAATRIYFNVPFPITKKSEESNGLVRAIRSSGSTSSRRSKYKTSTEDFHDDVFHPIPVSSGPRPIEEVLAGMDNDQEQKKVKESKKPKEQEQKNAKEEEQKKPVEKEQILQERKDQKSIVRKIYERMLMGADFYKLMDKVIPDNDERRIIFMAMMTRHSDKFVFTFTKSGLLVKPVYPRL
ncbi:hypothetical protein L596_008318 [Steinernema carpocapsae]|nr:hypothetical protein L596_008318 [Steinernema carpocapsae]